MKTLLQFERRRTLKIIWIPSWLGTPARFALFGGLGSYPYMVVRGLFGPDSLWVQTWQQAMAEMILAIGGCHKDESDDLTLPT